MILLRILCIILCLALAKQSDPIIIQTQEYYVTIREVFMDYSTGIAHILYGGSVDGEDGLAYVKLLADGTIEGRTRLCEDGVASISGSDDGKNIYVVVSGRVGYYDEVYFLESSDNGATWSPEVVPRKDPSPDEHHRLYPSTLVLMSDRIVLYYNGYPNGLSMVTRDPSTKEWSDELRPYVEKCDYDYEIGELFLNAFEKSETDYTVVVSYKCPDDEGNPFIFIKTNDFKNFKDCFNPRMNNSQALAFTMDKKSSRLFFACSTTLTYQSNIVDLTEYRPGGKLYQISLKPIYNSEKQALGIYYNNSNPILVHFQYYIYIETDDNPSLRAYPINHLWKSKRIKKNE